MTDDRLLLLDAPSLYFRAFHGVPRSVVAPDGTPVNAVRGLVDVTARLITLTRPTRLVAVFDADWRPEFRVRALPSYKAHRVAEDGGDGAPDELSAQLPIIDDVLAAFGIPRAEAAGFEADDVIGTLAVGHGTGPVDIATGDRDLFQLVDDERSVRVLYSVEKFTPVDEADITRRYGIPGRAYADFAVMRGDPSDGLPGVAGVGPKSAAALLNRYGSLPKILAAAEAGDEGFPAGSRTKILGSLDYLASAVGVVRVVTDVKLPAFDDHLPVAPTDPDAVTELAQRWGLVSSCIRLVTAMARG